MSDGGADKFPGTISEILSRSYAAFEKNPSIDAESSLFRLQVALFRSVHHVYRCASTRRLGDSSPCRSLYGGSWTGPDMY